jgi:hypothetical protein
VGYAKEKTMFEKFLLLPPIVRRAIIAVALFAVMLIDLTFPKCDITVFVCLASTIGWIWAIGILRPFLILMFFLLRAVFLIKTRDW